jgi:hypothetical protein
MARLLLTLPVRPMALHKWRVTFIDVAGDIGLIKANGDLLGGVGAAVRVEEVTTGSSDLYPGVYTNEIQTISVHKRKGFGCKTLARSFALSFKGKATSQIDVDVSADELKSILESLETIRSVNIRTGHHTSIGPGDCSSRSWIVTFTNLVHEKHSRHREICARSFSLTDPQLPWCQATHSNLSVDSNKE